MSPLIFELEILRLSQLGEGVAQHQDRTVFVEGALPGERVRAQLEEEGGVLRGRLLDILQANPRRRVPSCAVAGVCGGCDWQHAEESLQREAKLEIVLSALEHLGAIARSTLDVRPLWSSPLSMGYRRRAVLHFGGDKLGFFGRRSHQHVPIEQCPALTPGLRALPGPLSSSLQSVVKDIETVTVLESQGKVSLSLALKGPVRPRHTELAQQLPRKHGLSGVALVPKQGPTVLVEKPTLRSVGGHGTKVPLFLRPDAFAQANEEANAYLVEAAIELLEPQPTDNVVELYAGNGNFTFAMVSRVAEVLAIESSGSAVELAQRSAREGAVRDVRFVQGEVKKVCDGLMKEGRRFERMLLDPPRTGAPGVGKWALGLGVERVVYVGCDASSLARDARELVQAGYLPGRLQVVDMFPQTRHVEVVLSFSRGHTANRSRES